MTERMVNSAVIRQLWSRERGMVIPVEPRRRTCSSLEVEAPAEAQVRASPSELSIYMDLSGARASEIRVEWDESGLLHVTAGPPERPLYYRTFDFARAYDVSRARARFALGMLTIAAPARASVGALFAALRPAVDARMPSSQPSERNGFGAPA